MADKEQKQPEKPDATEAAPRKAGEDPVGKVYDSRLVRRLGHYLRPYWWQASLFSDSRLAQVNLRRHRPLPGDGGY